MNRKGHVYQSMAEKVSRLTEPQMKYIYLTPNRRLRAQTCDLSGCKTVCLHPKRKMKQVCIVFCVFMSQQGIIVHDNNYSQKKKNREIQIDLLNNDPPKRKCAPH
jgi:hypothetical protein